MAPSYRSPTRFQPSFSLVLLAVFLLALWLAGGASRADVAGQVVVRATAWAVLIAAVLLSRMHRVGGSRAPWVFLIVAAAIAMVQLIPLPPSLWQSLPGRELFVEAGQPAVWRPLSIVPTATMNALSSLVVPLAVLVLMAGLSDGDQRWLPTLLMVLVGLSLLLGLLQFSGAGFDSPLINGTPGDVGGPFANRNHFALFLAVACLIAPVWAFADRKWLRWSAPVALGITLLSLLMILATGSRAGLLLGGLALILALLLAQRDVQRTLRHRARWVFPAAVAGLIAVVAIFLLLSVAADRAASFDRLLAGDAGQDMRTRGLPTVLAAISTYFPTGAGLGGFDPIFRLNEPASLLKPTYFNHAHNDFLEIALDTGIVGLILLVAGLGWWIWASVQAWRHGNRLAKLGFAILLLVIAASLVDYPMRTPLMLAIATIAAVWLSGRDEPEVGNGSALPNIA